VPDIWNRARALEKLKAEPDFEPLTIAFKRVVNIIKKAGHFETNKVDESLFEHECEAVLFADYKKIKEKVLDDLDKGLFEQALFDIASLRDSVDAFFDGALVMAEDSSIRNNRLSLIFSLLGKIQR
jgi:glycyl-tRNA synthetase beta chain